MPTELYLDTARFGRMRLRAQEAGRDFTRLCGDEGGSAVIEELLRFGVEAGPESMRRRYPGLTPWRGVAGLKQALRALSAPAETPEVLIAGRSGTLMRLAARALFSQCRRVLHTDLEWPTYAAILREEGERVGGQVRSAAIEDRIHAGRLGRQEVIDLVAEEYRSLDCDGLFLSAVGFRGVRVPVAGILTALADSGTPKFVVVDAAQALGHVPWDVRGCDVVVGGLHKWLRSGHPLGLAYACTSRARRALRAVAREAGTSTGLGDPLFGLVGQLEDERMEPLGETADLSGLFCAAAALLAESLEPGNPERRFEERLANSVSMEEAARGTGWSACGAGPGLRSGILLLRNDSQAGRDAPPEQLRAAFQRRGLALSAYPGGFIRLSMPYTFCLDDDIEQLRRALRGCR